jgi:hypothetical protein
MNRILRWDPESTPPTQRSALRRHVDYPHPWTTSSSTASPPSTTSKSMKNGSSWTGVLTTGGKGEFTQWVHCEFFVSPETIRLVVTQQVCGGFF